MAHQHSTGVNEEERRTFLKALGVSGAAAAGSATLDDVRNALAASETNPVEPISRAVAGDLTGTLDTELLANHQSAVATQTAALTTALDRGFPADNPREEFQQVAAAGEPIYDHLADVGFFESTTAHLPGFDAEYIEASVRNAVTTDSLATILADAEFTEQEQVDLLATVVNHRDRIGERHWVQTDQLQREQLEIGDQIPAMTKAAAGGALLWLGDLDEHLWSHQVILTEDILADAVWEARAMAAGFTLMTEGAKAIGADDAALSDAELTSVLSSGFALQAIAQNLLPEDVYWVTEEMRAQPRTDLEPAETQY